MCLALRVGDRWEADGKLELVAVQASQFQLRQRKELEARELEKKTKEAAAASKRTVTEDDYTQLVEVCHVNSPVRVPLPGNLHVILFGPGKVGHPSRARCPG